jgi:hypothetical protein
MSLTKLFFLLCLFCFSVSSAACQSTKELTRAKAQSLIEASAQFQQPAALSLETDDEDAAKALLINKASASETASEAAPRALARFLDHYPQIAVANHLGLVKIEQAFVKEEKANLIISQPQWYFTFKARANEKGKAMWKEYKLPPDEKAIPLAQKQFGAVTGITRLADNQAQADFTWQWKANSVGKALDSTTEEFKSLPAAIQKSLLGQSANNYQPRIEEWGGERKVSGLFQRYDDGWRLTRFW